MWDYLETNRQRFCNPLYVPNTCDGELLDLSLDASSMVLWRAVYQRLSVHDRGLASRLQSHCRIVPAPPPAPTRAPNIHPPSAIPRLEGDFPMEHASRATVTPVPAGDGGVLPAHLNLATPPVGRADTPTWYVHSDTPTTLAQHVGGGFLGGAHTAGMRHKTLQQQVAGEHVRHVEEVQDRRGGGAGAPTRTRSGLLLNRRARHTLSSLDVLGEDGPQEGGADDDGGEASYLVVEPSARPAQPKTKHRLSLDHGRYGAGIALHHGHLPQSCCTTTR